MRIATGLALVACAAFLAVATAAGAPSARVVNSVTFTDSTGEDAAAPDIVTIVVSNDDAGLITFQINIPNRPTLTCDMLIDIFIDSDNNPSSGSSGALGADYVIELDTLGGTANVGLFRWEGMTFSTSGVPQTTLVFSYANGATIKVNASELGRPTHVNFGVDATSGVVFDPATGNVDFTNAHTDLAPDPGHGLFGYDVKIAPPRLVVKTYSTKPLKPRAGRLFTVRLVAARSDTGAVVQSEDATCKARAGTKSVPAQTVKVVRGQASCAFLIPKTAKGKRLRGSITVEFEGLKLTKSFSLKIG